MDFSIYLQSIIDEHGLTQNGYYPLLDLQVQYRKGNGALAESLIPDQQLERLEVLAGLRKFAQKGHVLLLGKPGSGKSTALRQLRWELAQTALSDEKQSIPVLVTLRSDRPLTEAICAEFRRTKVNVTTEGVNNLLFDDRLFLLLDGLNEIPSLEREQQIRQFRKDNPKTSMVFTSRELGVELGIEQKLEMCGLTEPQIRSFVEKELAGEADAFLRQLSSRLWELSEMPLLLKWLCDVFDPATQKIPQSTGELFQAVDTKFNTWKKDKEGVTATPDFWHWNQSLLQYLAFEMLRADDKPTVKRFQINKSEAEDLLENFLIEKREESPLSKAKRWLQDLLNHHLLQIATYANQIEFCHPLFQEYYAAEYLLKEIRKHPEFFGKKSECKYVEFQQKYLNLLKWTESIALMQSLVNEQEAVQIVALALQVDWVLGARLAGEVKPDFQFQTVLLVSQLDIPQLLKVALWGLTKSEIAVPALVEALSHQKDFEMRGSAAVALGKIKSEKSISGLNQAIADKKSDVRWWVTHALGQIGSEEVILPLIQVVTEDKSSDVRFKAAEALGINRSEAAISALLRVSIEDESSDVRWEAAEALGKIGSDKAIPGLLKAIEHSRTFQLSNAAYALGKIGSATAISGLLKLKNHPDYLVRQNIAYAFGNVSSDQAIPFLLELLQDNEPEVRRRSAEALGKIGSKNTISALLVATGDKDPDVQWLAAKALVKIDSEVATPILCHLIDHPNSWVR
ncbi:MAG: HEAT repeat domain-containing protein [Cyanobacteria bacterium P01_F01_bin.86]